MCYCVIPTYLNYEIDESNIKEVFAAVYILRSKYYRLGRSLGLHADDLDAIRLDNPHNAHDALNDVLLTWLRQEYNVNKFGSPSWKRLIEAVGDKTGGGNPKLAKSLSGTFNDIVVVCSLSLYSQSVNNTDQMMMSSVMFQVHCLTLSGELLTCI